MLRESKPAGLRKPSRVDRIDPELLAILARLIRRPLFLLGRWLAYALIMTVYVVAMAGLG